MRAVIVAIACVTAGGIARADEPDLAKARALYDAATQEMNAGKFDDAARDYGSAYAITHDPVLFYKIAGANQKAGKCEVAVVYYRRYVEEAKPEEKFRKLAEERMKECGTGTEAGTGAGAGAGVGAGAGSGSGSGVGGGEVKATTEVAKPVAIRRHGRNAAWFSAGLTLAFVTAGGVLAYSAKSSEQDIRDLYNGTGGVVPTYDASTQQKFKDAVDEGHRYQYLSWASFGAAGACAIVSAILFVRSWSSTVEPVVAPHQAGVQASWRF